MRDENSIKNKWRYKISDIEVNHFNSFTFFLSRFQEIVPLNAGNVLGAEDNLPAKKWLSLIRKTLNTLPGTCSSSNYSILSPLPDPLVELDADFEGSSTRQRNSSLLHRHSFHSMRRSLRIDGDIMVMQPRLDRRFSVCDRASIASRPSNFDPSFRCGGSSDDEKPGGESPATDIFSPMSYVYGAPQYLEERERSSLRSKYYSLRFLSLIPFDSILSDINLIYSIDSEWCCYSITVLGIAWWQPLCHDYLFYPLMFLSGRPERGNICEKHALIFFLSYLSRIIWLGDLNYRIALSYQSAKSLVEMHNWRALLEKDQVVY
ncbi:hypothetical protein BHE74_00008421 [Ensete ventricosum]|nr:hypothetical protein BHE74_00008421 [Ensete ventricosum]RZR84952.1 hypothetical protein BHM03_00011872 [Ensete ventricosum]